MRKFYTIILILTSLTVFAQKTTDVEKTCETTFTFVPNTECDSIDVCATPKELSTVEVKAIDPATGDTVWQKWEDPMDTCEVFTINPGWQIIECYAKAGCSDSTWVHPESQNCQSTFDVTYLGNSVVVCVTQPFVSVTVLVLNPSTGQLEEHTFTNIFGFCYQAEYNGWTIYEIFVLAGCSEYHEVFLVLPVEFIYARGDLFGDQIKVEFGTASEKNTKEFEVQVWEDGWNVKRKIQAVGESTTEKHYSVFIPANPGLNQIRIQSVDWDGERGTTPVFTVTNTSDNQYTWTRSSGIYEFRSEERIEAELYTVSGQLIKAIPPTDLFAIDLSQYPGSIYILSVRTPTGVNTIRLHK